MTGKAFTYLILLRCKTGWAISKFSPYLTDLASRIDQSWWTYGQGCFERLQRWLKSNLPCNQKKPTCCDCELTADHLCWLLSGPAGIQSRMPAKLFWCTNDQVLLLRPPQPNQACNATFHERKDCTSVDGFPSIRHAQMSWNSYAR